MSKQSPVFDLGLGDGDESTDKEKSLDGFTAEEKAFIKGVRQKKKKSKKIRITVDLDPEDHHLLKVLAIRKQSTIGAEGHEAIKAWLEGPQQVEAIKTGFGAKVTRDI